MGGRGGFGLEVFFKPVLKDDQIPQMPGSVLAAAHVGVDQPFYDLEMEKILSPHRRLRKVLVDEKSQLFPEPRPDRHLKTPFGPLVKPSGQVILEGLQ